MAWTPYYKPAFYRHLHHLVINGFYARDVDADDLQFLEYVKHRGSANSSMPSSGVCLLEELGFWHLPYEIQPGIERHVGKKPERVETPEERERRKASRSRWRAQREIRKQEREIAAAELAREEREQAETNRRRTVREIISDAEWDAAAPRYAPFGSTIDGKHVPQWKLEEMGIDPETQRPLVPARRRKLFGDQAMRGVVKRQLLDAKRTAAWRKAEVRRKLILEEEQKQQRLDRNAKRTEDRRAAKEQERRERVLQEARDNLIAIELMERQWKETANPYPTTKELQDAIVTLLNRTPGYAWSGQEMMRSLGCADVNLMNTAIDELVASGRLKKRDATVKRIGSESKQPGMKAARDWVTPNNLSEQARVVGAVRRRAREEIVKVESQIENLEGLLRTIERGRRRLK